MEPFVMASAATYWAIVIVLVYLVGKGVPDLDVKITVRGMLFGTLMVPVAIGSVFMFLVGVLISG